MPLCRVLWCFSINYLRKKKIFSSSSDVKPLPPPRASASLRDPSIFRMLALLGGTLGLTLRSVPVALRSSRHTSMTAASPVAGDVVKCEFTLRPAPEPSTYDQGVVSFVLGGGNYVTGLHETVTTMKWLGSGLGLG